MSNDPYNIKQGQYVNKKNLDQSISLPSGSYPLTDIDIANMNASKLLGGTNSNFLRWLAGVPTWINLALADIITALAFTPENIANKGTANGYASLDANSNLIGNLATKSIDNTIVPTDGMVLTYDNASGMVKFKTSSSSSMSEVEFLQAKSALGKLITVNGVSNNPPANTVITSYTPANGATFVLYAAFGSSANSATAGQQTEIRLRNNGVIKATESLTFFETNFNYEFTYPVKGDQLIGTGSLVYDIVNTSLVGSVTVYITGNLFGYLL